MREGAVEKALAYSDEGTLSLRIGSVLEARNGGLERVSGGPGERGGGDSWVGEGGTNSILLVCVGVTFGMDSVTLVWVEMLTGHGSIPRAWLGETIGTDTIPLCVKMLLGRADSIPLPWVGVTLENNSTLLV